MVLRICEIVFVFVLCVIFSNIAYVQPRRVHKIINDNLKNDTKLFKIPTTLLDGTSITVIGKIKLTETLQMDLISKTTKENICSIRFSPNNGNVVALSQSLILHNSSYNITQRTDFVTFAVKWIATSSVTSNFDLISILFESNEAGETFIEQCELESLSSVDEISVTRSAHIQRISFDFKDL